MKMTGEDRQRRDRRVVRDIQSHGCRVVSVFDPDEVTAVLYAALSRAMARQSSSQNFKHSVVVK